MTNETIAAKLDSAWEILAKSSDPQMLPAMKLLGNHIDHPRSFVTLTGETSSGKSTLINSLIGRKFLAAGVRPTTGTVVWLEFGVTDKERLMAVNRDATVEELTETQFRKLSEHPDKDLLRLKAELPSESVKGLSVFDTPGFNAVISEHTEVLKEFLPESDVVVFPVSYRVGFGASDRRLMELVCEVREQFGGLPVIVVVNRAPEGATESDKRIKEIRLNAEDSLHDKVRLEIVHSTMPTEEGESVLPETGHLWQTVCSIAFSEERATMLTERFRMMLVSLVRQRLSELDGELAAIDVGQDAVEELQLELKALAEKESESYAIVDKYMDKIAHELPKIFDYEVEKILSRAKREISAANKWVDVHQCSAYIYGHVLPFGTTDAVKAVEKYLHEMFERMDNELSEMANLAVRHLNDKAQTIENPLLGKLLANLSLRIGQRVAGGLASSAVRGVGGIGGSAAGMGNLVKMGVKQVGKLFGQTFSREVYTNIGKIFTKQMVQTMSACLQVVTEFAFFAWDACHWQGELEQKVQETISKWHGEVSGQIRGGMIEDYKESNYNNVKECYAALRNDILTEIENSRRKYSKNDLRSLRDCQKHLNRIIEELEV